MGRKGRAGSSKEKFDDGSEAMRKVPTPLRQARATANILEEVMRRKGVDDAWDALEQMHVEGKTTDKYTVSRMLMKTVRDGAHLDPARAYRGIALVERFIEMQPEDVDEVLFNALLDTCCRLKDLKRLESCVNWMRRLKVKPSPITLGILVKTYGQAGNLDKVLEAWDEMEEQRGLANSVTYGCMLDACVKCGNLEKAVEVFRGMRATGKHRNTILYTTMIKGYGLHKDLENALELFREMPYEGVPYNTITYNSILEACVKCGDVTSAEAILDQMVQTEYEIEPDLISYSTMLKGYCQNGDLLKALCMFQEMKEHSLRCDELVYNTLMEGCVKADDWKAGCGLFSEMVNKGLKPSAITASILSRLFQRVGHEDPDERVADLFSAFGLERPQPAERRARRNDRNERHGASRLPPSPGVECSPMESTPGMARRVTGAAFAGSPARHSPSGKCHEAWRTPLSRALMASLDEQATDPLPTGRVVPALPSLPGHGSQKSSHFHDQVDRFGEAQPVARGVESNFMCEENLNMHDMHDGVHGQMMMVQDGSVMMHQEGVHGMMQEMWCPPVASMAVPPMAMNQWPPQYPVDSVHSMPPSPAAPVAEVWGYPPQAQGAKLNGVVQAVSSTCSTLAGDSHEASASSHSRGPSLASLLPHLDFSEADHAASNLAVQSGRKSWYDMSEEQPEVPQPPYQPMVSPSTPFDCRSEAPTPVGPPLSSPGVRAATANQPSSASLLTEEDEDQQALTAYYRAKQERSRQMPPLATLLGPSEVAEVVQCPMQLPGQSTSPAMRQGNVAVATPQPPATPLEPPREAPPAPPAPPTPRRGPAIKPPGDGFGAFETEPAVLPLSPATMLLGHTPAPEAPANPSYSHAMDEATPGTFQSFFSQDMWSYFSDGPRW